MLLRTLAVVVIVAVPTLPSTACNAQAPVSTAQMPRHESRAPSEYGYEVVASYPHDRAAFTQGLLVRGDAFYESTGRNGTSSLREVDPKTGTVRRRVDVPREFFAEGLAELDGKLYQLTWQHHRGFVYDLQSFEKLGEFAYEGEGWGLTTDGKSLVMSDGSNVIRFLDPKTFAVTRTISVVHEGEPVTNLNELEIVEGELYANIWMTDDIVRIDPATGKILGWIDLSGLLPPDPHANVLNGIAYDSTHKRLFVTGKLWPTLFEIRIVPRSR